MAARGAMLGCLMLSSLALSPPVTADAACEKADPATACDAAIPAPQLNLQSWGYVAHNDWRTLPALVANALPNNERWLDTRLELRWQYEPWEVKLTPRFLSTWQDLPGGRGTREDKGSMNTAYVRWQRDDHTLLLGREVLTWGQAQWRSPSSPFYFQTNRNPVTLDPGLDLLRWSHAWQGLPGLRSHLVYIEKGENNSAQSVHGTRLLKLDWQGSNYLASLITASRPAHESASDTTLAEQFHGGFAQLTLGEAWLLYAEHGAQHQPASSGTSGSQLNATTLGASYTLPSGQTLMLEHLWQSGNGTLKRLTDDRYLWLGWQSSLQTTWFWRAEVQINQQDHSRLWSLYTERNLHPRLGSFATYSITQGNPTSEFASVMRQRLQIGLKLYLL